MDPDIKAPMPLGDELQCLPASCDVKSFEAFERTLLRQIAASLDCTYEELATEYLSVAQGVDG